MRKYMFQPGNFSVHVNNDSDPVYMCGGCLATMLSREPLQDSERIYNDCDNDIACDMCGKEQQ